MSLLFDYCRRINEISSRNAAPLTGGQKQRTLPASPVLRSRQLQRANRKPGSDDDVIEISDDNDDDSVLYFNSRLGASSVIGRKRGDDELESTDELRMTGEKPPLKPLKRSQPNGTAAETTRR